MENVQNNQIDEEIEIDLVGMLKSIWRKMPLIILVAVICAVIGFCYGKFALTPTYTSSTTMYILYQNENENVSIYQGMIAGSYVISDYEQVIKSRYVLGQVIERLDLNMSIGQLSNEISISNPENTRFVTLSVTDVDPERAMNLADEIRTVASEHIQYVMNAAAVNVVDEAELPIYPSSVGAGKYTVMGAAAGFALMVIIFALRFIIADAIRTSEDVENKLGVSCLSVIPVNSIKYKNK